jgi:hypothetical protein
VRVSALRTTLFPLVVVVTQCFGHQWGSPRMPGEPGGPPMSGKCEAACGGRLEWHNDGWYRCDRCRTKVRTLPRSRR